MTVPVSTGSNDQGVVNSINWSQWFSEASSQLPSGYKPGEILWNGIPTGSYVDSTTVGQMTSGSISYSYNPSIGTNSASITSAGRYGQNVLASFTAYNADSTASMVVYGSAVLWKPTTTVIETGIITQTVNVHVIDRMNSGSTKTITVTGSGVPGSAWLHDGKTLEEYIESGAGGALPAGQYKWDSNWSDNTFVSTIDLTKDHYGSAASLPNGK